VDDVEQSDISLTPLDAADIIPVQNPRILSGKRIRELADAAAPLFLFSHPAGRIAE
jgi:hypothetical protein